MTAKDAKTPGAKTCPICRRPTTPRYAPFCSPRCADEDLRRWISGDYRIPVAADPGEDEPDIETEDAPPPTLPPRPK